MRIHSDYRNKYALKLIGWTGNHWLSPRTIETGYGKTSLEARAASLNLDIADNPTAALMDDRTKDNEWTKTLI